MMDAKARPRIFVAEDEYLLALLLEDDLAAAGCHIVGPFTTLPAAIRAAHTQCFDGAVLDVNLHGEMVFPLADELMRSRIPFIFLTGYGVADLPRRFHEVPRIAKPHDPQVLARELGKLVPLA